MNEVLLTITLDHLEGPRAGESDAYSQPSILVGRAPGCHLVYGSEKGVSGRHAEITQAGGRFELVDHNSTNGTFVNDERITGRQQLNPGDTVRFGYMGPQIRIDFAPLAAAQPAPAMQPPADGQSTMYFAADQLAKAAAASAPPPAAARPAPPPPAPAAPAPRVAAPPVAVPVVDPAAAVSASRSVAATIPPPSRAPAPRAAVESSLAAAANTAAPAVPAAAKPAGTGRYLLIVFAVLVVAAAIVAGVAWVAFSR